MAYVAVYAPVMQRIALIAHAATRVAAVNRAFGTAMTPAQIAEAFADEDIDLLLAWSRHAE